LTSRERRNSSKNIPTLCLRPGNGMAAYKCHPSPPDSTLTTMSSSAAEKQHTKFETCAVTRWHRRACLPQLFMAVVGSRSMALGKSYPYLRHWMGWSICSAKFTASTKAGRSFAREWSENDGLSFASRWRAWAPSVEAKNVLARSSQEIV